MSQQNVELLRDVYAGPFFGWIELFSILAELARGAGAFNPSSSTEGDD